MNFTIAMLYAENGDIVATYDSFPEAVKDLMDFLGENPRLQDDIGLRVYKDGKPLSRFLPASAVVESSQERLTPERRSTWEPAVKIT